MAKAFLFFVFSLSLAGPALGKISLQKVASEWEQREKISELYQKTMDLKEDPTEKLKPLLKTNQKKLDHLQKNFAESVSFVRGEIENEKVLQGLLGALELSMLSVRSQSFQSEWKLVQKQFSNWFLFAADFPYEESSLVGLRTAGVVRSLLLDELERIQAKFAKEIAKETSIRIWFSQIRAPWPVDRVLVSEAKRLLKPPMMSVANAAASSFQRNPYQTSEQALRKVPGGQSEAAELLKKIWRESDIELMKTEINRIGKLKLRLARAEYEHIHKKQPENVQELIKAQLLDQAPINYFTGQALDLTSL